MTNENLTDITFILDRSGSMSDCATDLIGGFNQLIEDQKKEPGSCNISVVLFDTNYEILHNGLDVKEVPTLTNREYFVRGMTALYDALGKAVNEAGARFNRMPESERPGKVLFIVNTDGLENASREFNLGKIKEMVKTQQDVYNWDFVFLGADLDALKEYGNTGVKSSNFASYDKFDTGKTHESLSRNITSYRASSVEAKCSVDLTADIGDNNEVSL